MKKRINNAIAMLFAVLAVACARELPENAGAQKTLRSIQATVDESPLVKALLEDGYKVVWDMGDQIGVFSDAKDAVPFTYSGDGKSFIGTTPVSGSKFYGFFPYGESVYNPSNKKELSFIIGDGTTTGGANPVFKAPMVAVSESDSFSFKQTCGVLHFAISGSAWLRSVTLSGNQSEKIAGTFTVNLDANVPVLSGTGTATSQKYTLAEPVFLPNGNPYDVYFVLPPISFSGGFTIEIECESMGVQKVLSKKTEKAVSVSRAQIRSFALVDLDQLVEQDPIETLALERDALIALFNATDGASWSSKTGWCTEAPVGEWHGITTDPEGHVIRIELENNGLSGVVPAAVSGLLYLKSLRLHDNNITGIEDGFAAMPSLQDIALNNTALTSFPLDLIKGGHVQWLQLLSCGILEIPDEAFGYLPELEFLSIGGQVEGASRTVAIPAKIGQLQSLSDLQMIGYSGAIPEELYSLTNLTDLNLVSQKMSGTISTAIGNLTKLRRLGLTSTTNGYTLDIPRNQLTGPIPTELFTNCTQLIDLRLRHTHLNGTLPAAIGNLTNLQSLSLINNDLTGNLPVELCSLPFTEGSDVDLEMYGNQFSGSVPAAFKNWKPWQYLWYEIIGGSNLDISQAMPPCPEFNVTLLDGNSYSSSAVTGNELTVLFQWSTWCPHMAVFLPTLKAAYEKFHSRGFDVIGWSSEDEGTINDFLTLEGISWNTFRAVHKENSVLDSHYWMYGPYYPDSGIPAVTIFDKSGQLVWSDRLYDRNEFKPFLENWFGETFEAGDMYESTDFSRDGNVTTIQSATDGAGIDLVLMADGFSDRQINAGMYRNAIDKAVDALFTEEPFKSNRAKFNVSMVEVVSKNEGLSGERALGTYFGENTYCGGDTDAVLEYADKPFQANHDMDDCLVIVLINFDKYAGTCFYVTEPDNGDYGRGASIAYIPLCSDSSDFAGIVRHEAGGHGFAKLADEYSYSGTIAEEEINGKYHAREQYGWWKNVDFTSDPAQVKWSAFLNDGRYSGQGLGVYEGACTYSHGAYRPSLNSIMNNNSGGYNAPSRYAIWYRMGKLAYGTEWVGSYEDFVTYDTAIFTPAAVSMLKSTGKNLPPLAAPVFDLKQ